MEQRNTRRGGHSAPSRRTAPQGGRHSSPPPQRRRREPLRDNYYYEEPPRSRGGRTAAPQSFEDISSYSSPGKRRADQRSTRRAKPKRGRKTLGKTLLLLFVLLVLAGGVYVFGYMLSGLTMTRIDKDALGIDTTHSDPAVTNIALFGLDAREDENVGRSDALMVLTIDNKHHKLKLTSILRDSQVYIDDAYGYDKITHAYVYGGPEMAIRTLNQNFHLDIGNYVTVNFLEMARIVDAFGGVRLNVTPEEMEELNTNITNLALESPEAGIVNSDYLFAPGDVLLNGHQAVAYARIRHLEGGDDMRASRQQQVLQALIQQLKGKSKLSYPALVHDVVPLCETSLGYLDMMGLAPFALTDFSMETLTVPGEEEGAYGDYNEDGAWVYMYDTEAAAEHIRRFIYDS